MGVPNKFDRLGTIAGNKLPAGYLTAEFLESTGATEKMTVACPPQPYTKWQLETEHAVKEVTIQGKTQQEGINNGVNSFQWATYSYLNSDSVWVQQFFLRGGGVDSNLNLGSYTVWDDFKRIMIYITPTTRGGSINGVPYEGESTGFQINVNTISLWGTSDGLHLMPGKKKTWKLLVDDKPAYDMIAVLDPQGVPCMYDRVSKQAVYNSSTGQFIVGMTIVQARQLSKLPITEAGTLTVSLPWEAQLVGSGVPAALTAATAKGWTITVQYRDPEPDSKMYNKYALCANVADMAAVNADYKNDLTADGEWIYPLPNLQNGNLAFNKTYGLKKWSVALPNVTTVNTMLQDCYDLVYVELDAPFIIIAANLCQSCTSLRVFRGDLSKITDGTDCFYLCRQLREFHSVLSALQSGYDMFSGAQLDKASALRILTSIPEHDPAKRGLWIGIHQDFRNDEEVLNAIAEAEGRGWTFTLSWNGVKGEYATAAANTFATLQPVYAKLVEKNGSPHLDWGHYVTNWEENGYQEFASLEEAQEYFNIEE